ncbi:RICIN domain-containing protein [Streptomyces sp. NPDC055078]
MRKLRFQGSPPPARTGLDSGASDEGLAAALRAGGGTDEAGPVALLLARHWQPVFDYAYIGTPTAKAATLLTTAAFHQVLDNLRQARTTAAIRPLLLTAARQTGRSWAVDERVTELPELRNPGSGRTVPAEMFALNENRALVSRSFLSLPGPAQCLLWHAEVEADDLSVPTGLLAIEPRGAAAQLDQARELFRAGILRAHLELAQNNECRHYNRLLDVSLRRGGALIPDIRAHLAVCRHCRFAAEQLDHGDCRLALLLAEGILGTAAQPYLDSRPTRTDARYQARAAAARARLRRPGRHSRRRRSRALPLLAAGGRMPAGGPMAAESRTPAAPSRGRGASQRGRTAAVTGLGVVTGLLAVVTVVSELWADDDTATPAAPGESVSAGPVPGGGGEPPPQPPPSATSAAHPVGPFTTRLRHTGSGLCLDVRDRLAEPAAEAVLTRCAGSITQEWTYEDDGLLRTAAVPGLCLNSHELDGVLVLAECADATAETGPDVRYDLTIQGRVIPRWNESLAVVPGSDGAGSPAVVKVRDGSPAQRWTLDHPTAVTPRLRPGSAASTPTSQEVNASPTAERSSRPVEGSASPPPPERAQPADEASRFGESRDVRGVSDEGRAPAPDDSPVRSPLRLIPLERIDTARLAGILELALAESVGTLPWR